jgi:hypothetical protein
MKDVKQKISQNHLIVTKADKGKTPVILQKESYINKIEELITQNNYKITKRHKK